MHLTRIALTDFRVFSRLELDLPGRLLVLVGDNAQGKTTLLEAIYYLATFTSLQAGSDRQLINFTAAEQNQAVGRLVADFSKAGQSHRLEVRLIQENGGNGSSRLRKQILLDGVTRPAHEVVGFFSAVIFLPQMTRIIDGSPDERRRYLNLALSQAVPGYAKTLAEYTQVVTQRNALLKQLGERGGDPDQLTYWDELLVDRGAFLILHRIRAIQELERLAARIHTRLTHSAEVLRLLYQPSYDPKPSAEGQYTPQFTLHSPTFQPDFCRDPAGFPAALAPASDRGNSTWSDRVWTASRRTAIPRQRGGPGRFRLTRSGTHHHALAQTGRVDVDQRSHRRMARATPG